MSYELFKHNTLSENKNSDPLIEAITADAISRSAIGLVDITEFGYGYGDDDECPIGVKFYYKKDRDREEEYTVTINTPHGRHTNRYFKEKFDAEAVFEKLVRDYGLIEDPSEDDKESIMDHFDPDGEPDDSDEDSIDGWNPLR